MKSLFLSIALMIAGTFVSSAANPEYVGHRGCARGVENTMASFLNGMAEYPWIECDVRSSADSVFIISHDETTERLGGNLKVFDATYEQLAKEKYLQKRRGYYYQGSICTLAEMLDSCAATGTKAVIELKWTPGINYTDTSRIPELISEIRKHVPDSCYLILTSMKPCLEAIMAQYPEVNVQFLGGGKWKDSLPWILEHKIDVDLIHGALTKEDVDMLHQAGLKVNCWTVNDPERAAELESWGVDFITTDILPVKK